MRKINYSRKGFNFVRLGLHGRLMKEDPPAGGGATANEGGGGTGVTTPPNDANNQGGNSGGASSESGGANNTGQQFDPATFWQGPAPAAPAAPSGESASGTQQESGAEGGGNLQEVLTAQLNGMSFGDPIFTPEVAAAINNGDFKPIQDRFQAAMQQSVRNSLAVSVAVMRPLADQIMAQMREEFGSTLTTRDNNDALVQDFPTASNPQVRPIIQGIFDQALKNTKGDRKEAVKQTKEMIRLTANLSAGDLDYTVAPRGAEDSGSPLPKNFNWLEELTSR